MSFLSQVWANVVKSPKTTISGILTIVGLFTPVSPVITTVAAGLTLILGAGDGHKDVAPGDKPAP